MLDNSQGPVRRIRTVLNGDQRVFSTELELLHTPSLQRLYDLHQLGFTDRIFIDASHSRLHHVVGVMEQASRLMCAIGDNLERHPERTFPVGANGTAIPATVLAGLVRADEARARLVGLLHDLTHAPFGHTLEDEIELVDSKHDEPERQAVAFYRLALELVWYWARDCGIVSNGDSRERPHAPPVGKLLSEPVVSAALVQLRGFIQDGPMAVVPTGANFVKGIATVARAILDDPNIHGPLIIGRGPSIGDLCGLIADLQFAMRALLHLELLHKSKPDTKYVPKPLGQYPVEVLLNEVLGSCGARYVERSQFNPRLHAYLLDVIGNTICADLLDYAKRDAFFANLKLDYDSDRIVENMTLVAYGDNKRQWDHEGEDPFSGKVLRTAMGMFSHKLRMDVPGALLHLLHVRFYVYQRALFHPTKCVAGAMLGSALQLLGFQEKNLPDYLSNIGDAVFLELVRSAASLVRKLLAETLPNETAPQPIAQPLLSDITNAATRPPDVARVSAVVNEVQEILLKKLPLADCVGSERLARDIISIRSQIGQVHAANPDSSGSSKDKNTRWLPAQKDRATVATSIGEIDAALLLLERLASRRYYRPVFRLLPNVSLPLENLSHETVAEPFLKPPVRWFAERTIEAKGGLPLGSVVMHCPVAKGPQKIAMMLMVWRDTSGKETAAPLREIGRLDDALFGQMQSAISALEKMYASMWRLVVSVEPSVYAYAAREAAAATVSQATDTAKSAGSPRDSSLRTFETIIGEVLGRVMRRKSAPSNDETESLPNDWTMREELTVAATGPSHVLAAASSERALRLTTDLIEGLEQAAGIDIRKQLGELSTIRSAARPTSPKAWHGETGEIVDEIVKALQRRKGKGG